MVADDGEMNDVLPAPFGPIRATKSFVADTAVKSSTIAAGHFHCEILDSDHLIAVKDLTVEVPGRVLVEDFTAVLRRNDFVALIGPTAQASPPLSPPFSAIANRRTAKRESVDRSHPRFRQDLADLPSDDVIGCHPGQRALGVEGNTELSRCVWLQRR